MKIKNMKFKVERAEYVFGEHEVREALLKFAHLWGGDLQIEEFEWDTNSEGHLEITITLFNEKEDMAK